MKRMPWKFRSSQLDPTSAGFLECFVLIPETDLERTEVERALDAEGVRDSMSFIKNGINGRLDIPADLKWEPDGAVRLTVTTNQKKQIPAWFWVVECDDQTGRRFTWWSTKLDRNGAIPWA